MNQLSQLVGLILPDNISWWPLAPGWYVLAFIGLSVVLYISYKKRQHYLNNRYRREALSALAPLTIDESQQLLLLLQTVSQSVVEEPIELQLSPFLAHLNDGLARPLFDEKDWQLLTQFAFQKPQQQTHLSDQFLALKTKCQQWIEGHHYEC